MYVCVIKKYICMYVCKGTKRFKKGRSNEQETKDGEREKKRKIIFFFSVFFSLLMNIHQRGMSYTRCFFFLYFYLGNSLYCKHHVIQKKSKKSRVDFSFLLS